MREKTVGRQFMLNGFEANGMNRIVSARLVLSKAGMKRFGSTRG